MSLNRVLANAEPLIIETTLPSPQGVAVPNKTVTRADLADKLSRQFGLMVRDSKEIVESVFDEIAAALVRGENVKLAGFGSFNQISKSARTGRNPKNGVEAVISPRRVLSFKPSNSLRELVKADAAT
jgi:integration host factor subunit alpha